jgi:hypothetical protein
MPHIASALQKLRGRTTEVLHILQNLFWGYRDLSKASTTLLLRDGSPVFLCPFTWLPLGQKLGAGLSMIGKILFAFKSSVLLTFRVVYLLGTVVWP